MSDFSVFWQFIFLFLGLFIITNFLKQMVVRLVVLAGGNSRWGVFSYSLLFFPGTVIHETAHLLTAMVLMVPTGKMTIFPEEESEDRVRLGSLEVQRTDFFRATLVGLAPVLVGVLILFFLSNQVLSFEIGFGLTALKKWLQMAETFSWREWAMVYLVFAVSNTMSLSRADMRTWPVVALLLGSLTVVTMFFGWSSQVLEWGRRFLLIMMQQLVPTLATVVILNSAVAFWLWLIYQGVSILTGRRVHSY